MLAAGMAKYVTGVTSANEGIGVRRCFCVMYVTVDTVKFFIGTLQGHEGKDEPMVAFICNRPSMYLTERGWIKDDDTGCLRDPVDILNYCRKVSRFLCASQ